MKKSSGFLIVVMLLLLMPVSVTALDNITITASPYNYYIGQVIRFSGVNNLSDSTYLFDSCGPDLWSSSNPSLHAKGTHLMTGNEVISGNPTTFIRIPVNTDGTWEYAWDTGLLKWKPQAGNYCIRASADPVTEFVAGRMTRDDNRILLKKPYVTASAFQSGVGKVDTVKKGDAIQITGTAEGKPYPSVVMWVFGDNYANRETGVVNADASFSFKIDTTTMNLGQYFVIVQHPMENRKLDVIQIDSSLRGAAASEALINAINAQGSDDTYAKTQFSIVIAPTTIPITPVPTTSQTTAITTIPTSIPTTGQTTSLTTSPTTRTPKPTATVNHSATIEKLEKQIAEQNAKIEEQGNWIDQILRFLGLK